MSTSLYTYMHVCTSNIFINNILINILKYSIMVYMRFERGDTAVTNGCADRAAGSQLFSNVGGVQSEIISAADEQLG